MNAKLNTMRVVRDGVCLAYHEAGAGDGSPILFVHGFGCNGSHFRLQQQHFAASTRTVAVDLRGHGASDAPLQDYGPIGFADDLRWLCDHLGLERPIVVGHSMGGNIALKLAARAPDFVKAIALNDKVDESRDLATHVQTAMLERLRPANKTLKDLGVKQAPFVVLIGAVMPSVLAEISFVTNPQEARLLKGDAYRQKIAEALFEGVRKYQLSLKAMTTVATQR